MELVSEGVRSNTYAVIKRVSVCQMKCAWPRTASLYIWIYGPVEVVLRATHRAHVVRAAAARNESKTQILHLILLLIATDRGSPLRHNLSQTDSVHLSSGCKNTLLTRMQTPLVAEIPEHVSSPPKCGGCS